MTDGICLRHHVAINSIISCNACSFSQTSILTNYLLVTQSVGLSKKKLENMGRGVSSGGGQSSLGYLFGSGEAPKPAANNTQAAPIPNEGRVVTNEPASKPTAPPPAPEPVDITKQIPAGIHSTSSNNYMRADGQNTGNFITVWFSCLSILFYMQCSYLFYY